MIHATGPGGRLSHVRMTTWRTPSSIRFSEILPWPDPLKAPVTPSGELHPDVQLAVEQFVRKTEAAGPKLDQEQPIEADVVVLRQTHGRMALVLIGWFEVTKEVDQLGEKLVTDVERAQDN